MDTNKAIFLSILSCTWLLGMELEKTRDLKSDDVIQAIIQAKSQRQVKSLLPYLMIDSLEVELKKSLILAIGQIGDPSGVKDILKYLADERFQGVTLFSIGEAGFCGNLSKKEEEGNGVESVVSFLLKLKVSNSNQITWFETLVKLTATSIEMNTSWNDSLWKIWQGFSEQIRDQALFYAWRINDARYQEWVLNQVEGGNGSPGQIYFLYRKKLPLSPQVFLGLCDKNRNAPSNLIKLLQCPLKENSGLQPVLLEFLNHVDWRVRVEAVKALYREKWAHLEGAPFEMEWELSLLEDPSPQVRRTFIQGYLANREWSPESEKLLVRSWKSFSPSLKWTVLSTLPKIETRWLELEVSGWKNSKMGWFHSKALSVLGKIPGPSSRSELESYFQNGNSVEKVLAFSTFSKEDSPFFRSALQSDDPFLFAAAIDSLGDAALQLSETEILGLLEKLRNLNNVQYFSLNGLGKKLDPKNKEEQLMGLLDSPHYNVRLKAAECLELKDFRPVYSSAWENGLEAYLLKAAATLVKNNKTFLWELKTEKGMIVIELFLKDAPVTCASIMGLSGKGYFDAMPIHRVVPDFVVQAGDPRGDGSGGPGYVIPCEINQKKFERGSVGMALAGKDTGGSQFFICHSAQPHLDGGYTVFGKVVIGMAVADFLEEGNVILTSTIKSGL